MPYRIRHTETPSEGVKRIAAEQLARIKPSVPKAPGTTSKLAPTIAIHTARKALKKTRALMALVRSAIGGADYRAIDRQLRDLGRGLSQDRDRDIIISTLDELLAHVAAKDKPVIKRQRAAQIARLAPPKSEPPKPLDTLAMGVTEIAETIQALDLSSLAVDDLWEGVGHTYRRGRRLKKTIGRTATKRPVEPETLHRWRKVCQRHWRQLQLVSELVKKGVADQTAIASQLSRCLGAHNDLDVLQRNMIKHHTRAKTNDVRALSHLIAQRQADLCRLALDLAVEIYARKPKEHISGLRRLSQIGHSAKSAI
jgi:CHAD domain